MARIVIRKADLKRQTFRSGGPGGQYQNKTESGVRYIHVPTGITAESRSERSQHQNDRYALSMLVMKLSGMERERREAERIEAYRSKPDAAFGHQTRSYFAVGDRRVIDHETGVDGTWDAVVRRGKLDPFLHARLRAASLS